jgi:hypothetical protein
VEATSQERTGVGVANAVVRIWKAFGLQPQRVETLKLSADRLLVEKIGDIVGLYLNLPTKALVLCVDETSQIQALDCTQPSLPMMPGVPRSCAAGWRASRASPCTSRPPPRRACARDRGLPAHAQ